MINKKGTELTTELSEEQLAVLRSEYPVEQAYTRILLPRLGLVSQDKYEGKGKAAKLVAEAGMFFIEHQSVDVDEATGKRMWTREDLGNVIEGIIIYQRKQLRFYDETTKKYTSSPIYDSNDKVVPLFCDKVKVAVDTPDNLKKMYPGVSKKTGKPKSNLEEDRILYVLYNDEMYQMNLRSTSMYAFFAYARQTLAPSVVTTFGSEPKENGATQWNQMNFHAKRKVTPKEASMIIEKVGEIKSGIADEKAFFAIDKDGF